MVAGQEPTVLVGASGGCLAFFSRLSFLSTFSLSLRDGPIVSKCRSTAQAESRMMLWTAI